jgi:hypothetical protein
MKNFKNILILHELPYTYENQKGYKGLKFFIKLDTFSASFTL